MTLFPEPVRRGRFTKTAVPEKNHTIALRQFSGAGMDHQVPQVADMVPALTNGVTV